METSTTNNYKRATELTEKERDDAVRRMNEMKMSSDNVAAQVQELNTKVMNLTAES